MLETGPYVAVSRWVSTQRRSGPAPGASPPRRVAVGAPAWPCRTGIRTVKRN